MYHHRNFRGAYTKTLTPSGDGDVAARIAVGLEEPKVHVNNKRSSNNNIEDTDTDVIIDEHEDDECIQWYHQQILTFVYIGHQIMKLGERNDLKGYIRWKALKIHEEVELVHQDNNWSVYTN